MKSTPRFRALAQIVIGLIGLGVYQMLLHFKHPVVIENDFLHGLWFGVCLGLELTGLYLLFKSKSGSAA
jgi:hypothetical protein